MMHQGQMLGKNPSIHTGYIAETKSRTWKVFAKIIWENAICCLHHIHSRRVPASGGGFAIRVNFLCTTRTLRLAVLPLTQWPIRHCVYTNHCDVTWHSTASHSDSIGRLPHWFPSLATAQIVSKKLGESWEPWSNQSLDPGSCCGKNSASPQQF